MSVILMQLLLVVSGLALAFRRVWKRRRGQIARRMAAFRAVERPVTDERPVRVAVPYGASRARLRSQVSLRAISV